jgi:hypothetical protein
VDLASLIRCATLCITEAWANVIVELLVRKTEKEQ